MAASWEGHVKVCDLLLNRGADIDKANNIVWDILYYIILYYTVMCTVVIDIIIIYYSMDGHLLSLPVRGVMSMYVTFSSTGELM